jgi:hypothetical protein
MTNTKKDRQHKIINLKKKKSVGEDNNQRPIDPLPFLWL